MSETKTCNICENEYSNQGNLNRHQISCNNNFTNINKDFTIENFIRFIIEQIFKYKFPKIRPSWLINDTTGQRMEIDIFNNKLKLAFEYQGYQHYIFPKNQLNSFICNLKQSIKTNMKITNMKIEKYNKLVETYPHLFLTEDDIWENKYDIVVNFIEEHKRLPRRSNPNEKYLEIFIKGAKRNYNDDKLSDDKYEKWTKLISTYPQLF